MKKHVFFSRNKINQFLNNHEENEYYFIADIKKFLWFWQKFTVFFYNKTNITSHLTTVIHDLIKTEFDIEIKNLDIQIYTRKDIEVTIDSSKNKLLFGKLGKNCEALSLYFARAVSHQFKTKFNVLLKIANTGNVVKAYSQFTNSTNSAARFRNSPRPKPINPRLLKIIKKAEKKCLESKSLQKIENLNGFQRHSFHEYFSNHKEIKCFSTGNETNRILNLEIVTSQNNKN